MKAKVTLEQLEMWAKAYPNMTIVQFLKIFLSKNYPVDKKGLLI